MNILSSFFKSLKMVKEQKDLMKEGYTKQEAIDISRYKYLVIKYQKQGYSDGESASLAEKELIQIKANEYLS